MAYDREAYLQGYNETHREEACERASNWYQANRERALANVKSRRARARAEMIAAYGGACQCCGEENPRFLTIDHINGGGTKFRKERKHSGDKLLWIVRKADYPKDEFRLLCYNCNSGRAYNGGICPHVTARLEMEQAQ